MNAPAVRPADPQLAASRAATRVLVHHPGSNHLAYELVAGLQEGGFDCSFATGFFYAENGAVARLVARLPGALRDRIERELRRRHHPGVAAGKVSLHPLPELIHVGLNRLGVRGDRLARVVGWRNDVIDARVAARVRRERPRVVIGHDGSALLAARAAREVGACAVLNQVVAHVDAALELFAEEAARSPEFAETISGLPPSIVARHRRELAEADRILVPSEYVRDSLSARGVSIDRIAVLPYGVDIGRFQPSSQPPPSPRRPLRVLFVGTLSQRKGVKYLLEAARLLGPDKVELVLVGRMIGAEAAFAPYRGAFRHIRHVPYHEVHALYRDADVFVYPSLHEGSAFVTYEALASGLPVVTTLNAGSVVRDGEEGFVVPIRDVDALVERIDLLRRDEAMRQAMRVKARARAEQFTWAHYRARLCALIDGWSRPG
ncbi:MAG TPA: glycosyltransferase family 4 protein [Alphaproteobacteria bacterium]|nr:glycosyltransferase family 4 protein [Alphaproteobacteria bacterium]